MSISRSTQTRAGAPAQAFDFDVVTDVPARPSRKPEQAGASSPPEAGPPREKPATAEA